MRVDPTAVLLGRSGTRRSPFIRMLRRELLRRLQRGHAMLRRLWRRSLQFRVVSITLLLSASLVGIFGFTVADIITGRVLEGKISNARKQVLYGSEYAANQFRIVNQPGDPALRANVPSVVAELAASPELGNEVEVVILPTMSLGLEPQSYARPHAAAYDLVRSAELAELRQAIAGTADRPAAPARQFITANPDGGTPRQYLAFGVPVPTNGGDLELFYLFPLDSEVSLVNEVSLTLVLTGVTLVALLALVAVLITRMVVKPVRMAARTAQRLSAGLLDQRMEVRGEDDLARLAAAFNQMAGNLQRQIIRLEEMSRMQRRFTSDVSHELRTPLTTVRMAADLIFSSREDFEPAVARSAELLQAELDRFEDLLTDLLEISRFDAGFASLDAEPTDLGAVVRRVGERLSSLADRCEVPLELDLPENAVIAEVDGRRIERVLRNLVGNAIEHGERRPVRITLDADDTAVALTVRDHGIGLKAGEEKLVFNRFWRADPSRARQTGGTGLGLSISLEDARLHGGWLEAWGAPGQGAQFRLTLPLRAGDRLVTSPLRLVPDDARADGAAFLGGSTS